MILAASGEAQELNKKYKGLGQRKIRIVSVRLLVVTSILFGIFFAWNLYKDNHLYKTYEEVWSQEILDGMVSNYIAFGDNVMKYTRDGANYINASGTTVWNQPYEMNPIAAVNGSFVAIADQKGSSIVICNEEGYTGTISTTLPILKVDVSSHGVVVVILEDKIANPINYYDKDGTLIDVSIYTSLEDNSGYPLDISISPEGTQLMISYYVYVEGGIMQSHVVFYNFSQKERLSMMELREVSPSMAVQSFPK